MGIIQGGDPVANVFLRFDQDLTLNDAAGDLGVTPDELEDILGLLNPVLSVLDGGTMRYTGAPQTGRPDIGKQVVTGAPITPTVVPMDSDPLAANVAKPEDVDCLFQKIDDEFGGPGLAERAQADRGPASRQARMHEAVRSAQLLILGNQAHIGSVRHAEIFGTERGKFS